MPVKKLHDSKNAVHVCTTNQYYMGDNRQSIQLLTLHLLRWQKKQMDLVVDIQMRNHNRESGVAPQAESRR